MPPQCRLFLVAPSTADPQALAACLTAALAAGDAASLLIAPDKALVRGLMPIARAKDVAVLIDTDAQLAVDLDADGVHIAADCQAYDAARQTVGAGRIVGVDCQTARHNAMECAEAGADYVMMDETFRMPQGDTLISWWASVMQVPVVASHPGDARTIGQLAATGAEFVRPHDSMWQTPDQAAAIVSAANRAIAEALA